MAVVGWLEPALQFVQSSCFGFESIVLGILRGPFLFEENKMLRAQVNTLLAHEQTHQQLFQENERLRSLLRFREQVPWQVIPAEVIGREWNLWLCTILVDRGSKDGVRVGMAVVTPEGLVGRVSEVGFSSSRIILLTDPHFRVAAMVTQSRTTGLVMGTSSGDCLLTYVPLDTPLKSNEAVLTAGGKGFCPKGIPIGYTQLFGRDRSPMFYSIRIRPVVALSSVHEVLIVKWPPSDSGQ